MLWSGSYNTWSDVRTLVAGLERAMERNARIRFVSTGGEIPGHDESTYRRAGRARRRSRFADRFDLRGWLIADELPAVVAGSDLGVLTEKPIYEGMLGSKNRVVQWMSSGLAVAYNQIGDLGELLEQPPARTHLPGRRRRRAGRPALLGGRASARSSPRWRRRARATRRST